MNNIKLQAEEFWHYSLCVYQQVEVKQRCLSLQNEYGLNINMILLCGYLTQLEVFVSAKIIKTLSQQIENIDQQLKILRRKRNACKKQQQDLYRSLLQQELLLEKSQQAKLISAINGLVGNRAELFEQQKDNFISYFQSLESDDVQILEDIVSTKIFILNASKNN